MTAQDAARWHPAINQETLTKYPWLRHLAQAFLLADELSDRRIAEEARRGRLTACHPGCCHCCRTSKVPVTPLELQGISWYVCEVLRGKDRTCVREQLASYPDIGHCPFLVDGLCAVRPVRPLSCRQFFVLTRPCTENEDVTRTRPDDILMMGGVEESAELREVATLMLQGLGAGSRTDCVALAGKGELVNRTSDMLGLSLSSMVDVMDLFTA